MVYRIAVIKEAKFVTMKNTDVTGLYLSLFTVDDEGLGKVGHDLIPDWRVFDVLDGNLREPFEDNCKELAGKPCLVRVETGNTTTFEKFL